MSLLRVRRNYLYMLLCLYYEDRKQCRKNYMLEDEDEIDVDYIVTRFFCLGINLGKDIDDIYEGITVAGITCQPYRESYVKTKRVTCMVDSPGVNDFKEGPILVKVKGVALQEMAGGGKQLVTWHIFCFI